MACLFAFCSPNQKSPLLTEIEFEAHHASSFLRGIVFDLSNIKRAFPKTTRIRFDVPSPSLYPPANVLKVLVMVSKSGQLRPDSVAAQLDGSVTQHVQCNAACTSRRINTCTIKSQRLRLEHHGFM